MCFASFSTFRKSTAAPPSSPVIPYHIPFFLLCVLSWCSDSSPSACSFPLLSSLWRGPTPLGFKPASDPSGPVDTMWSLGALSSEGLQPSLQRKGIVMVLVFSFFLLPSFSFYFEIISNLQESLKNSADKSHLLFTWIHQFWTLCYIYFYPPPYLPTLYFLRMIWEFVVSTLPLYSFLCATVFPWAYFLEWGYSFTDLSAVGVFNLGAILELQSIFWFCPLSK